MEETMVRLSKAGRNLFARIPDEDRGRFFAGDRVKVVLVEKSLGREEGLESALGILLESSGVDCVTARRVFRKCLARKR